MKKNVKKKFTNSQELPSLHSSLSLSPLLYRRTHLFSSFGSYSSRFPFFNSSPLFNFVPSLSRLSSLSQMFRLSLLSRLSRSKPFFRRAHAGRWVNVYLTLPTMNRSRDLYHWHVETPLITIAAGWFLHKGALKVLLEARKPLRETL